MSHFNDTVDCPECGDEGAYFNGMTYECPNCGFEWDDELKSVLYTDDETEIRDNFRKQEVSIVGEKLTVQVIRNLFSPEWKYFKWRKLYKADGLEEDYCNELTDVLIDTCNYHDLISVAEPPGITNERKIELACKVAKEYLESRDELSLCPSVAAWTGKINAPEEFIVKILPKDYVDFKLYLPLFIESDDFTTLFHYKLSGIYKNISETESELMDEISFNDIEDTFTEFVTEEPTGIEHEFSWLLKSRIKEVMEKELSAIKKYRKDLHTKDSFEPFITESKKRS